MNVQVIEKDGKPEWAVILYETYLKLLDDSEMLRDIRDYDEARQAVENGEELVPAEITFQIIDGENPVKVWREYRGMTRRQLADDARVSESVVWRIESGKYEGSAEILGRIAGALNISWDEIECCHDAENELSSAIECRAV